jgi:hypothetical protein
MEIIFFICLALFWIGIGATGFVYYWTKDYDLTLSPLPITLLIICSLAGIFTWVVCWIVLNDTSSIILFKKRNNGNKS